MRKIRIGNDIAVQWSLVAKGTGEPFVVEGKDIRLTLKSIFATTEIEDFTAQGNTIAWTFKGAEQKQTGIYSLVVSVVDAQGAMVTTDVCQFVELVACSCEADGADEAGVQTESIELTSTLEYVAGSGDYDDTELWNFVWDLDNQVSARREEILNLQTSDVVQAAQLTELSAEVSGLSDGIVLRNVGAEDTDESVEEPEIPAPTPSASNEWKCVADRRLLEGDKKIIFTTYADGTPLNAKEVIVQTLCDTSSQKEINGYAVIQSTNNKTRSLYGAIQFERNAASSQNQILDQMHFRASPIMYMVAEICRGVKCAVASPTDMQVQGGSVPFQIYEDIVSIELAPNEALTSAAPYLKIYAR